MLCVRTFQTHLDRVGGESRHFLHSVTAYPLATQQHMRKRLYFYASITTALLPQVLDGLSYLQWRGVSHLDLQPDNLVLSSTRFPSVKLVDFGSARKVEQTGTAVPVNGLTEYIGTFALLITVSSSFIPRDCCV